MRANRSCILGCPQLCPAGEPCWMRGCDDLPHLIEAKSERDNERVRAIVREHGGEEALARHDENMKRLRLGITGAENAWHSISRAQRRTLLAMEGGRVLTRQENGRYDAIGAGDVLIQAGVRTVRALAGHELVAWDGGAFDPEAKAVLTERGSFVLKHRKED